MKRPLITCLLLTSFIVEAVAKDRPNVLFIMSDDHTAQAVGAYATVLKSLNPTPTLDRLAAEGMVFDNVFCSNSRQRMLRPKRSYFSHVALAPGV